MTPVHKDGVCIVTGKIGGRIGFELRLPDAWNGRYYQIGTGGFSGKIFSDALAWDAAKGNAVAMSDAGHQADSMDASWAKDNPQAVTDYGYRAIKLTSDAARLLVARYYGRAAKYRYFAGCSNGGRQALVAAQRWPADWDGIVAGAPLRLWTDQFATFASLQKQSRGKTLDTAAIGREARATCPPGTVVNGAALDPERCRYRPKDRDVAAIVAAGYEPTATGDWPTWIVDPKGPVQAMMSDQAHFILENSKLDMRATLNADGSLAPFRAKGGKIISYFGWGDAALAPHPYAAWYDRQGASRRNWFRLFMVPGMYHCQGGDVPDAFGQSPASPASAPDADHDIRRAIEAWVEQGSAPNVLIASKAEQTRVLRPR
jgi:feruloyl esterase